jgi:WD40 repeat protein
MGAKITVKEYTQLEGHKQGVYALLNLCGSSVIVSAGGDGAVVKWDLDENGPVRMNPEPSLAGVLFAQLPEPVFCLMEGLDGVIWAGTQGGLVFKLVSGEAPRMIKLGTSSVFFISRWMDGRIAVGLGSGELVFLDDELQLLDRKSLGKKSLRCCLGDRGLIGGSDGLIWRLDAQGDILKRWEANSPSVFCLAEDAQGDIVSGGRDALLMWMGEDGELKQEVKAHLFTIHALAGSDLGWLASGSMDKTVKVWDRNTGELLKVIDREKYPSRGHSHSVNALCWVGRLLASAGDDKIIRIWEVSV